MSNGEIVFDGGAEALDNDTLSRIYGGETWIEEAA